MKQSGSCSASLFSVSHFLFKVCLSLKTKLLSFMEVFYRVFSE